MAPESKTFTEFSSPSGNRQNLSILQEDIQLSGSHPLQSRTCKIAVTLEESYHDPLLDLDFMHQKFEVEGLSTNYIARLVGCSRHAVASALLRHGISLRQDKKDGRQMPKGQEPYGFKLIRGQLVPHKGEQKVIAWMVDQRNRGVSLRLIIKGLEARRIRTKNGKSWHANTVRKILLQRKG